MITTYKIVQVADGTFEVFKQIDGKSVRTMGNYGSLPMAERVKTALETGSMLKVAEEEG